MDEKSLIKKYQKEISILKQELQQLKLGMMENPLVVAPNQEDLVNLKLQVCFFKVFAVSLIMYASKLLHRHISQYFFAS